MKIINEQLIKKIEEALNISLYEWQRDYLLDKPMILDLRITGRVTGKTTVYIIKQLFASTEPLMLRDRYEVIEASDWWCCETVKSRMGWHPYPDWYKKTLKDIYTRLNEEGIKTREVFFR